MATFAKIEQLADHAKYKLLLRVALAKAKQTTPIRFTYFEKFKFGEKVFPLLLVDNDPAVFTEVKKRVGNITAVGKCRLNEEDELVFDLETGSLNRANLKKYLATFQGVRPVYIPGGPGDKKADAAEAALKAALAGWTAARAKAINDLKQLESKIKAMADREGDAAIVLLRAIQANLTAEPASARQIAELEKYLQTDAIIKDAEAPNGFGIKIALRQPLLAALAKLKPVAKP